MGPGDKIWKALQKNEDSKIDIQKFIHWVVILFGIWMTQMSNVHIWLFKIDNSIIWYLTYPEMIQFLLVSRLKSGNVLDIELAETCWGAPDQKVFFCEDAAQEFWEVRD